MANTKQAKKMIRKTAKRTIYNRWWKSQIKDAYKSIVTLIAGNQANSEVTDETKKAISTLQKKADKAAKRNIIHKNKAARIKSKAMKSLLTKTAK